MADISKEIKDFKQAIYGEEVRGSMVSMAEKLNNEVSSADVNKASLEELNEQAQKNIKDLEKLAKDSTTGLNKIDLVERSLTELGGKVTAAESNIQKNAEALELKASKTEVTNSLSDALAESKNYSDGKYSSMVEYTDSAVKAANDEFSVKVSNVQKELKNISIGGRNLVRGSRDFRIDPNGINGFKEPSAWIKSVDDDGFTEATLTASGLMSNRYASFYSNLFPLGKNQTILVSVWIKIADLSQWDGRSVFLLETFTDEKDLRLNFFEVSPTNDRSNSPELKNGEWAQLIWSMPRVSEQETYGRVRLVLQKNGTISFKKLKVEFGSLPTDWSPAPEDSDFELDGLEGRIVTAETSINQNRDEIALRATKTELTQTLDDAKLYSDNQLLEAQIYSDAQLKVATDQIDMKVISVQDSVDAISVGARNLSKKSDFGKRYAGGSVVAANNSNISVNEYEISITGNPNDLPGYIAKIPTGKHSITVSGYSDLADIDYYFSYRKSDDTTAIAQDHDGTSTNDNGYFELHFDYDNDEAEKFTIGIGQYPYLVPYKVWNVKIELGTLATDWSPAPEDTDANFSDLQHKISVAETRITQNSTDISQRATKTEVSNATKEAKDYTDGKISPLNAALTKAQTDLSTAQTNLATLQASGKATQDQLDAAKAELKTAQDNLAKATNDILSLGTRVSTAETSITQNATDIALRATKTEVSSLQGGGRNLLRNSDFKRTYQRTTGWDTSKNGTLLAQYWDGYNSGVPNSSTCYHAHVIQFNGENVYEFHRNGESWMGFSQTGGLEDRIKADTDYVFTCEFYRVDGTNFSDGGLYFHKTGVTNPDFFLGKYNASSVMKTGQWSKFSYKFHTPTDMDLSRSVAFYIYGTCGGNGTFYVRKPMLVEGTVIPDWDLAPEDMQDRIDICYSDSKSYTNSQISPLNAALTKAQTDLSTAQTNLATLQASGKATQDQLDAAKADLKTAQDNLAKATNDLSALTTRVSTAETSITQNATDIALRATKTEVSTAEQNAKSYADGKISPLQTALTKAQTDLSTAKTNLENLQMSGQATQDQLDAAKADLKTAQDNLAKATNDLSALTTRVSTAETSITQNATDIALRATKTEVSTAEQNAKSYADGKISPLQTALTKAQTDLSTAKTNLENLQMSGQATQDQLDAAKAELKTAQDNLAKATNDISSLGTRVSTAETNITQNANDIKLRATKTEVSTAEQNAKSYADGKYNPLATRMSTAETTISQNTSAINLRATKDEVSKLTSGNRNLLRNSDFKRTFQQTTGWDTSKNGTLLAHPWGGYNPGVPNSSTCYHAHLIQFNGENVYEFHRDGETWIGISQASGLVDRIKADTDYVFTCEFYRVDGTNFSTGGLYFHKTGVTNTDFFLGKYNASSVMKTGQWSKFSYKFHTPTDMDLSRSVTFYIYGTGGGNGTFYVRKPMLVEGTVIPDWDLAPEDMQDRIDICYSDSKSYTNSQITVTNNRISQVVEDAKTVYITNTDCQSMIQTQTNGVLQTAESWKVSLSSQLEVINNNLTKSITEKTQYMEFNNQGLWIGDTASASKLLLRSNEIMFVESGRVDNPPMKISAGYIYIEKLKVVSQFELGPLDWRINSNGVGVVRIAPK